ncbi:MAG: hypothetical protein RSC93_13890, partial [Erysipelotrichaceae bacterium]
NTVKNIDKQRLKELYTIDGTKLIKPEWKTKFLGIAKQLNISPYQLSYVTGSGVGEWLLFYGNVILPFTDKFPENTELYSIMTTKLDETEQE